MTDSTDRSAAQRRFIHSSGRFDRSDDSVRASVKALRKKGACLITHTELSNLKVSDFPPDENWAVLKPVGSGRAEYIVEYDRRVLRHLEAPSGHRLSLMRHRNSHGVMRNFFYAVSIPFLDIATGQKLMVLDTHMPLDNTKLRARIWVDAAKGAVRLVKRLRTVYPGHKIVFLMDVNKNYRQAGERAMIEKHMARPAGLKQSWEGHYRDDHGGTHGRSQLIDTCLTDLEVLDCDLLADDASSDHRPWMVTVQLRGALSPVDPVPPKPSLPPKPDRPPPRPQFPNAPVLHPWARRSRRWKRANAPLWRQIKRWRRQHPR